MLPLHLDLKTLIIQLKKINEQLRNRFHFDSRFV